MEILSDRNLGPIFLNDELFVINGAPLKFHLHGYNESESRSMTQIIQDFGGMSSEPDDPDTFVFCERGCPFNPEKYNRYNIQYFYDSIVALQPQELMNYKIHSHSNKQTWSVVDDNESVYLESIEENNNNSEESSNYKLVVTVDRVSPNRVHDDRSRISHFTGGNNDYHDTADDNLSSSGQHQNELLNNDTPVKTEVSRANRCENNCYIMIHRLNEDRVEVRSEGEGMNDEIGHDSEEMYRFESFLDNGGDDSDYTLVESNELSGASVCRRTPASRRRQRRSRNKIFTEKENKKIIEWIMKKEVIPSDFGTLIWEEMIRAKVLKDRTVLPYIYAKHFREKLKNYTIFKKYMKNSIVS